MTLYDFNRAGYDSLPNMSKEQIAESLRKLVDEYTNINCPSYFMLLNNNKRYYTVFNLQNSDFMEYLIEELLNIFHYIFQDRIKSIEFSQEKDAIEIWGVYEDDDLPCMFLLFDYDWGVITV